MANGPRDPLQGSRGLNVDSKGALLLIEQQTTMEAIPAAARGAVLKKVADGQLHMVVTFTATGQPAMQGAAYDKKGEKAKKPLEVMVKADGTETRH